MRNHTNARFASFAFLAIALAILPAAVQAQFPQQRPGGALGGTSRQYQNATMVGDAMIMTDPETRQIIVIADEETNQHIREVVNSLDRPKPQVLIKVVFLEVTHRNSLDFGAEARYTHNLSDSRTGEAASLFGLASQTSGGFYRILSDDLEVTLRALAQVGKTEILSRPSILARNNQQATIIVGSELPFITNTRITDNGQTINTLEYRDIGIILSVTPFITSDGLIEMIVSPEISALTDQTVPISDTVSAPVIAKRAADTVVVTENGKTVVIGGLMENNKTDSVRKVPILGDIPLLGALFRRKVKDDTKTELLIFLTPYLVKEPRDLAGLTLDETSRTELAPKAFSEDEVTKYLNGTPLHNRPPATR